MYTEDQGIQVFDYDDYDDDEVIGVSRELEEASVVLRQNHPRRPAHIDEASWRVAQSVLLDHENQAIACMYDHDIALAIDDDEDGKDVDAVEERKPPAAGGRRIRDSSSRSQGTRHVRSKFKIDQEEEKESASFALALQLQEDESSRERLLRQQQEQSSAGFALALQLDEEEQAAAEERERANRKPDNRLKLDKEQVLASLQPCQLKALKYVQKRAAKLHEKALPGLRTRVVALGHTEEALQDVFEYIRNDATIIIHLTQNTLNKLTNDTHYRSLFETTTSGGTNCVSTRMKWESTMFGPSYDGCLPSERVKYGCLNVTGDITGVKAAASYGTMVMALVPHVRYRTTFFSQDTGGAAGNVQLATNEYYAHVLAQYTDVELRSTLELCRMGGAPGRCEKYKEVQIHGPVCLATDVQSLSVPGTVSEATSELLDAVMAFQAQTNCNILWQGDFFDNE
jgi:hypothetical protein